MQYLHNCITNTVFIKLIASNSKKLFFIIFRRIFKTLFFLCLQVNMVYLLSKVSSCIFFGFYKMNIDVWVLRTLCWYRWFISQIFNVPVTFLFIVPNRNFLYCTVGQYSRNIPSWPSTRIHKVWSGFICFHKTRNVQVYFSSRLLLFYQLQSCNTLVLLGNVIGLNGLILT